MMSDDVEHTRVTRVTRAPVQYADILKQVIDDHSAAGGVLGVGEGDGADEEGVGEQRRVPETLKEAVRQHMEDQAWNMEAH